MAFAGMHRIVNNGNDIPYQMHTYALPFAEKDKNRSRGRSRDSALYQGKRRPEMGSERLFTPDLEIAFLRRPAAR